MCNLSLNIYEDGFDNGFDNGFNNGKDQMLLDNIKALMLNTGCSLQKAMEMLNVPEDKREYIVENTK